MRGDCNPLCSRCTADEGRPSACGRQAAAPRLRASKDPPGRPWLRSWPAAGAWQCQAPGGTLDWRALQPQ